MERAVFGNVLGQREEECRDVPTSRRQVNKKKKSTTGQRRDVVANSVSTSLKAKGPEIEGGIGKMYRLGHGKQRSSDLYQRRKTGFCIFFFFEKLLMFYRLMACIIKSSML